MSELTKYRVILNGTVMPNEDREDVIDALCDLFHSSPAYMEKLLDGEEVPLKKEYARSEADKICRAVRAAGAQCKLSPVREEKLAVLDDDYSSLSMNEDSTTVFCPDCQQECDSDWESCQYCGSMFIKPGGPGGPSGFSFSSQEEVNEEEVEHEHTVDPVKKTYKTELIQLIGPKASFYAEKFEKLGSLKNPKFSPTWHWPAFFVFFFWALYRKMWVWAALHQLSAIVLMSFVQPGILWLPYLIAWPLCANYLYYRHVSHRLSRLSSKMSDQEKDEYLARNGGVSKLALWLGIAGALVLTLYFSAQATEMKLLQYEQEHGGSAATANLMRGDGSALQDAFNLDSNLGKTSKAISEIAVVMKLLIAGGNRETNARKIDLLVTESENETIKDAWGGPIYIRRELDRVVILSPGPDGIEKTDDDVLKSLSY